MYFNLRLVYFIIQTRYIVWMDLVHEHFAFEDFVQVLQMITSK